MPIVERQDENTRWQNTQRYNKRLKNNETPSDEERIAAELSLSRNWVPSPTKPTAKGRLQERLGTWSLYLSAAMAQPYGSVVQPTSREKGAHAKKFRGTTTFDEALVLARDGWPEGGERARKFADPLVAKLTRNIQKLDITRDVEGFAIDIGRYCEYLNGKGGPEHWMAWTYGDKLDEDEDPDVMGVAKVRIVVNTTPTSDIPGFLIEARGAAVAALVQCLEFASYRVQVDTVFCTIDKQTDQTVEVWSTAKELGQPLNMNRLAYAVGHPSKTRRLDLAVLESRVNPVIAEICNRGFGSPFDPAEIEQGDVYLGRMKSTEAMWLSEDEATNWVLLQLMGQGVRLKKEGRVTDAGTAGTP